MTGNNTLTEKEILSGKHQGVHVTTRPIRYRTTALDSCCICPKFNEQVPCDNWLPRKINELFKNYCTKKYTIQGKAVFEIPVGSTLVRPFNINMETINIADPVGNSIRANHIIFKDLLDFPDMFTPEEKQACECYPMAEWEYGWTYGPKYSFNEPTNFNHESFTNTMRTNGYQENVFSTDTIIE